ncbi:hypothetical protein EYF80_061541 [Liparis tanakae]|uniref:Uncharacterized protein n=1 Tax=Liparis tanakae TaxID=230148 RepID=A0A4Z2EI70_9TELE|nr:hypothetical protein EYF80_061541 [Liparis tanakae]
MDAADGTSGPAAISGDLGIGKVPVQMQMNECREKQSGRGQRDGHEGRQIEGEREPGRGYHPRRSLSQPLIVACAH